MARSEADNTDAPALIAALPFAAARPDRARARSRRKRPGRGMGAAGRRGGRGPGLEPHRRSARGRSAAELGGRPWRTRNRPTCSSIARPAGWTRATRRSSICRSGPMTSSNYRCVVDLVYSGSETHLVRGRSRCIDPRRRRARAPRRPGSAQLRAVHRRDGAGRRDARGGAQRDERLGHAASRRRSGDGHRRRRRPKARVGVTPPRRRGGSGRFLTDVLVELGLRRPWSGSRRRSRRRASAGVHARAGAARPERRSPPSSSPARSPSATGSTISTSACSRSTWGRPTC